MYRISALGRCTPMPSRPGDDSGVPESREAITVEIFALFVSKRRRFATT
jgi:hypothetical protein